MVRKTHEAYLITSGNAIPNDRIEDLRTMLGQINQLHDEELKELYKKRMKEGRISAKGGAGLGFIDIRRKTGQELEYEFLPMTGDVSFFVLTTIIPKTL